MGQFGEAVVGHTWMSYTVGLISMLVPIPKSTIWLLGSSLYTNDNFEQIQSLVRLSHLGAKGNCAINTTRGKTTMKIVFGGGFTVGQVVDRATEVVDDGV